MCHDAHGEEEQVEEHLIDAEAVDIDEICGSGTDYQEDGERPYPPAPPYEREADEVEAEEGVEVPVGAYGETPRVEEGSP